MVCMVQVILISLLENSKQNVVLKIDRHSHKKKHEQNAPWGTIPGNIFICRMQWYIYKLFLFIYCRIVNI